MVLELARRGVGGDTVALGPGGFWNDRERAAFGATLRPSIALVRALRGALPTLVGNPVSRTALLAQLSARPWDLSPETVSPDLRGLADAPSTTAALDALTRGPDQRGAARGTVPGRVTLGWGARTWSPCPSRLFAHGAGSRTRTCTGSGGAATTRSGTGRRRRSASC
ncbi:hypothetical protein [Nocardiopsis nanhaiensis]